MNSEEGITHRDEEAPGVAKITDLKPTGCLEWFFGPLQYSPYCEARRRLYAVHMDYRIFPEATPEEIRCLNRIAEAWAAEFAEAEVITEAELEIEELEAPAA